MCTFLALAALLTACGAAPNSLVVRFQSGSDEPLGDDEGRAIRRVYYHMDGDDRLRLFGDIQRMLALDAVNVFIFNPAQVALARKGLKGLWASSPIFANDMAAVSWQ